MSDETRRIIIKKGIGAPTIPASNDHRDGTWIATDIYIGENYLDTSTGLFYHRNSTGIIPEVLSTSLNSVFITAKNTTGVTISKGKTVYISGASGQLPTIALAKGDAESTAFEIGVASFDIPNNTNVPNNVTVAGIIEDVDTSAFVDGDVLFVSVSTAGNITKTPPSSPNFSATVGFCLYSHPNNGKLLIRTENPLATNTTLSTSNRVSPTSNAVKVVTDLLAPKISPVLITPTLGVAQATSLGIGGAVDASSLTKVTSTTKGSMPFPVMTLAQRNAISTPATGLYIFNTTRGIHEWYDGQVWLNCNLVKRQNKEITTLAVGSPVLQDSATTDGVLTTNVTAQIAVYGVVVDGDLTADGWLTVAVSGDYDVLCEGTVTRNQLVRNSNTEGVAETLGTGSTGTFAITNGTRSGGGSSLVKCLINKMDTF